MANPQVENGYTKIAHEITEHLMAIRLSGASHRVVMAIIRKTYGFHKKEDEISLDQFEKITRLPRRTIIYSVQDLEAKNLIKIHRRTKEKVKLANVYSLNKDYDTWVVQNSAKQVSKNRENAKRHSAKLRTMGSAKSGTTGVVQNNAKGSAKSCKKVVQSFAHTKDTTKDNTKDNSIAPLPAQVKSIVPKGVFTADEWNELIDSWGEVNTFSNRFYSNKTQRAAIKDLVLKFGKEKYLGVVRILPKTNKTNFFPHITTPDQLLRRWNDLEDAFVRYKRKAIDSSKVDTQQVDKF